MGPIKVVNNRTTRGDNNENQTTNTIYDQNTMSIIKKIITKTNSNQINPKQNKLSYSSLQKIRDLSTMRLVDRSIKKSK